jgi:hypothetical protein
MPRTPGRSLCCGSQIAWSWLLEDEVQRAGRLATDRGTTDERFALPLPAGLAVDAEGAIAQIDLIVAHGSLVSAGGVWTGYA